MSPLHHVSVKRRLQLLLVSLLIVIVYLFICGGVMMMLEKDNEENTIDALALEIEQVSLSNHTLDHLESLGLCHFPTQPQWTFSGSVFYVLTVITTIGYGSMSPRTFNGKSFTFIFAIFGIALIGNILTNCAVLLMGIVQGLMQRIQRREVERRMRTAEQEQQVWDLAFTSYEEKVVNGALPAECLKDLISLATNAPVDDEFEAFLLAQVDPLQTGFVTRGGIARALVLWYETQDQLPEGVSRLKFFLYIMLAGVWIVTWAAGFAYVEAWRFRDGMWFCFITMTTIGFGDFVPVTTAGRIMSFIFVVPGLGIGATALSALWKAFDFSRYWWLQKAYRKGKVTKKLLEVHGILLPIGTKTKVRKVKKKYRNKLRDFDDSKNECGTPLDNGIRHISEESSEECEPSPLGQSGAQSQCLFLGEGSMLTHPLISPSGKTDSPVSLQEAIPLSKDSLLSTPAMPPSTLLSAALPARNLGSSNSRVTL
eukprot:TRINITY_DN2271_c0_g1_i2.p1 TRINITY_DN2271_c0_g1~~TRINITY_DN2271_c0_g1_i2.p1  ORF type:complete len:482 (+),score=90.93 TRINITY_DN2271_c0_g1_i2:80-1525(+)